jgi:DNA polymerase II large subunit
MKEVCLGIPTVHEAYAISPYTRQWIELLARAIESTFGIESEKQKALVDFM